MPKWRGLRGLVRLRQGRVAVPERPSVRLHPRAVRDREVDAREPELTQQVRVAGEVLHRRAAHRERADVDAEVFHAAVRVEAPAHPVVRPDLEKNGERV